jgi:hypothetical protein
MKRLAVFHPFAFGLFPVLSLLSGNLGEADLVDAVPVAAMTLALVAVIMGICQLLIKDIHRSGVVTSGIVLFIFAPFHVFLTLRHWLSEITGHAVEFGVLPVYIGLIILLVPYVYFFATRAKGLDKLSPVFNIVSVFLVGIPSYTIAITKLSEEIDWAGIHQRQHAESLIPSSASIPHLPDIYYIIMDRYAGPETLKDVYGFDNQDFLDYLNAKGFYVATKSTANYPTTAQSLASSLNLQYINYLEKFVEPDSTTWMPIHALLQDHKVSRELKSKGYQYIHLGSWWEPTRKNKFADENAYFTRLTEMFYAVYGTTMFKPISSALGVLDFRYEHWKGNRRQFENLMSKVEAPGPKFVLAHFLLPHDPYVFSRDGVYLPVDQANKQRMEDNYINQLVYTNRMLRRTIDTLLSKSRHQPIIVLQADEGPYPRRYAQNQNFDWGQATVAELNQKMKILNSFYLPGVDSRVLYPTISPVNAFRVVFNLYFRSNLPLLPDESFVYKSRRHPYKLFNITSQLRRE